MRTFFSVFSIVLLAPATNSLTVKTTKHRIQENGYSAQEHTVITPDHYRIKIFRILPSNTNQQFAPSILLQHGVLCSSDFWVINGRGKALAYLLSDAGYDVWLGNSRGNTYGKNHTTIPTTSPKFWSFDWHQIGELDVPTMIDYILQKTNKKQIHYIGHSQGATGILVLMSKNPDYNKKIISVHFMNPAVFWANARSGTVRILSKLFGLPSEFALQPENKEILRNNPNLGKACDENDVVRSTCFDLYSYIFGWTNDLLNRSITEEIFSTHPAGACSNQLIHFFQLNRSGKFRQYDYGEAKNFEKYGRPTPPSYNLRNLKIPTYVYYGGGDVVIDKLDVEHLIKKLPNVVSSFLVKKWNHMDLAWAKNAKDVVLNNLVANLQRVDASYLKNVI